jgi:hypothetical protein
MNFSALNKKYPIKCKYQILVPEDILRVTRDKLRVIEDI